MAIAITSVGVLVSAPRRAAADTFSDPSFTTETIATVPAFTLVGLAFAPDGRLFVWQKNGVVLIIKDGELLPTPFIDLSAKVNTYEDRGFWGFAFDPDFVNNGFVYMTYTYENAGNPNSNEARTSRLVRVTASTANPDVALPATETPIMGSVGTPPCSAHPPGADCIPADGGSHTLGSVVFAADGTMFVGVGDGADPGPLTLRAQSLDSVNGKILRINKDGTAPVDNPYYDSTKPNSVRSKVWLYGVRNPFGFAQQPGTERIMFGDVGWNTWEEVNLGLKGANYGWPCYEGNDPQPFFQGDPICVALPASAHRLPFHTYDHNVGGAAIGGPFYTASVYPEQYQGNFFFNDYSYGFIKRVVFDANGEPQSVQPFATDVPAPTSMVVGPDGLIYYLSFTTGEIRRIRWDVPLVQATATPSYGLSPLTVDFSSAGSMNPGGGAITYLWNFGDGATSTEADPSHTYTSATPVTVAPTLVVTNSAGRSASRTLSVTIGSTPPTPAISTPVGGTPVSPGQTVNFAGSATDPEDGALPASALAWTVLLHHNQHVHTFVSGTGASGSFMAEDHGDIGTFAYELVLTATDSTGLKSSTSVTVPVVPDTVAPTTPATLTATAAGPNRIDLTWAAATDNVGVTEYWIERCQAAGCSNYAQIGTSPTTSFADTTVVASTAYRYRVRAADAAGNLGAYSPVATRVTPPPTAVPSAPRSLAAMGMDRAVRLSWSAPASNGGATVTDYVVQRSLNGGSWTTVPDGTSTARATTVAGLTNGGRYAFRVAARNSVGLGAWSTTAAAVPATTPSAPRRLVAAPATRAARLSWRAPASSGGFPIRDYVVQRSANGGRTWRTVRDGVSTARSVTVRALVSGHRYTFRVRAKNGVGPGPWSARAATTPR